MMDDSYIDFSKTLVIMSLVAGSFSLHEEANFVSMPLSTYNVECIDVGYPWELVNADESQIPQDNEDMTQLVSFASRLITESKDIEFEIMSVVSENFWEMI